MHESQPTDNGSSSTDVCSPDGPDQGAEDLRRPPTPQDFRLPWMRTLVAAQLAYTKANALLHAAQVRVACGLDDPRQLIGPEWDREDALSEVQVVKSEIVDELILAIRLAVQRRSVGLDDVIRQVPSVRRMRRRLRRLERVVVALAERAGVDCA